MIAADPARWSSPPPRWLGTPYHDQASVRGVGCDCLGLVGASGGLYGPGADADPALQPRLGRDWGARAAGRGGAVGDARVAHGGQVPGAVALPDAGRRGRQALRHRHRARPLHPRLRAQRRRRGPLDAAWRRRVAFAFLFPNPADPMASIILAACRHRDRRNGRRLDPRRVGRRDRRRRRLDRRRRHRPLARRVDKRRRSGSPASGSTRCRSPPRPRGAVIPRVFGACAPAATSSGRPTSAGDRDHRPGVAAGRRWRRRDRGHRVFLLRLLRRGALRGTDHRHRAHLGRRQDHEPRRRHLAAV